MRLYRCNNCGKTFEADAPACKDCAIDQRQDPRLAGVVVPVETIHFDPPHPKVRGRGLGHLACNPKRQVAGSRATGEPAVVNCGRCRDTDEWKKAYAAAGEPEFNAESDEMIEDDKARRG